MPIGEAFSIGASGPHAIFANYRVHHNTIVTYACIPYSNHLWLSHVLIKILLIVEVPHLSLSKSVSKIGVYTLITEIMQNFPLKRAHTVVYWFPLNQSGVGFFKRDNRCLPRIIRTITIKSVSLLKVSFNGSLVRKTNLGKAGDIYTKLRKNVDNDCFICNIHKRSGAVTANLTVCAESRFP